MSRKPLQAGRTLPPPPLRGRVGEGGPPATGGTPPPSPTLPRKGGGGQKSPPLGKGGVERTARSSTEARAQAGLITPSPLVGEGWGGGLASSRRQLTPHPNPPPQGGRAP